MAVIETCRCGQGRSWHEGGTGRCLLTGPQTTDGCDCTEFSTMAETTLPPMALNDATKKELQAAGKRVRSAVEKRDWAIRCAVEMGGSLREVGEAVGLSHTAVKFIAHGRPS